MIKDDFGKHDYVIFSFLCLEMDTETNFASLNQKNIREQLQDQFNFKVNKSTVSKSVNNLIDLGYIIPMHNRTGFMVNPDIFYYGSPRYLNSKRKDFKKFCDEQQREPRAEFNHEL